jgi:hypothetical protein
MITPIFYYLIKIFLIFGAFQVIRYFLIQFRDNVSFLNPKTNNANYQEENFLSNIVHLCFRASFSVGLEDWATSLSKLKLPRRLHLFALALTSFSYSPILVILSLISATLVLLNFFSGAQVLIEQEGATWPFIFILAGSELNSLIITFSIGASFALIFRKSGFSALIAPTLLAPFLLSIPGAVFMILGEIAGHHFYFALQSSRFFSQSAMTTRELSQDEQESESREKQKSVRNPDAWIRLALFLTSCLLFWMAGGFLREFLGDLFTSAYAINRVYLSVFLSFLAIVLDTSLALVFFHFYFKHPHGEST